MRGPSKRSSSRRDILNQFPATAYERQVVRYASEHDGRLGMCYAEAADRLASTHRGRATDDALLMPFLYLYRHAIELDLKYSIKFAAQLRRNEGHQDLLVDEDALNERLPKKHRHRLMALVEELDKHLAALGLALTPTSVRRTLTLIATSDPSGETFRYTGALPDEQDHIDFPRLAQALADAYRQTSTAWDILSAYGDQQYDALEEYRAIQADLAAEIRAEYEDYG